MAERGRGRHVVSIAASMLGAGAILSASSIGVHARPAIVVEQTSAGPSSLELDQVGDVHGSHATVSGDGRFVVYQGDPPAPAEEGAPPDERATTIYLTDRAEQTTAELTPVPPGMRAGNTVHPVISGDGCAVVAITEMALDVFRDDDTGVRWDVYRLTLPHCGGVVSDWELVSTRDDGSSLARDDVLPDDPPAVSRGGAVVAYTHPATHLFENEGLSVVTVVDLTLPIDDPERSRFVAGMPVDSPNTTFIHSGIDQPAVSADGRYVAYRSDAASQDAVAGWGVGPEPGGPATGQIFVWDRDELDPFLAVRLVSVRPDGSPSVSGASEPALSRDGRVVAFTSADVGLVPAVFPACDGGCPTQVYRLDRDADQNGWLDEANGTSLTLVSAEPGTEPPVVGTAPSSQPTLSADGQLTGFVSKAQNLQLITASSGGDAQDGDILVHDGLSGTLRRVTVSHDGVRPAVAAHARPHMNDTGRTMVFDTLAAAELLTDVPAGGRQIVALSSPPKLSLADADLGTTLVGLESDEWYVAVINEGPSAFVPAEVSISNPRFKINEEGSTCTLGSAVPPGGDCTVRLSFTPSAPVTSSGTLTVSEVGFGAVSVSSTISGSGGEPALRTDPGGADLGVVDIGESSNEFQFDVMNISVLPTSVASVRLSGAHHADFAITTNNCADRPLNPRASCSVGVTFTPTDAGRRTALVEISTPQGQYTAMVIAGDAQYSPVVAVLVEEVRAGRELVTGGAGYEPNTEVQIVFGDGSGDSMTVITDEQGKFFVSVPVAPTERGGERTIVVQSAGGAAASVPIKVIEEPQQMIGMPGFGLGG